MRILEVNRYKKEYRYEYLDRYKSYSAMELL